MAEDNDETRVTVVVIDVPAAVSVYDTVAPGLFEEQGIDLDVVAIPPGTADMTPQMQRLVDDDPGVVHVIGNDTFCISAFNGLRAVGFQGTVTTLYHAVIDTYADEEPRSETGGISMYTALAALAAALDGIEGEVTPATVISTLRAMPEMELLGSGGQGFRCNGNALAGAPAICVRSTLITTLDTGGQPTTYETVGGTPIED